MTDTQLIGFACRIRTSVLDLLSLKDVLVVGGHDQNNDDNLDDGNATENAWDFIGDTFCLNAKFMYINFCQMISLVPKDQKVILTQLANQLFESIEEVNYAVEIRNISLTHYWYNQAAFNYNKY